MTREEAIECLKSLVEVRRKYGVCRTMKDEIECLDMAIQALEQQPCDDCVSRQAVNTLVDELARAISDERCCISRGRSTATIMQDILDLPPVILQPILDKIKAEIIELRSKQNVGVLECLDIIDKYKAESEE